MSDKISGYGFRWGNILVNRLMHLPGRGRVIHILAEGTPNELQVYVSERGRSMRVWLNGKELTEVSND